MFNESELAYIQSQPLLRLATVTADGQPDVDAVGYRFDGQKFYIGGHNLENSRKYKNVQSGQNKISLIIDDLKSTQPWQPRGIKIHGECHVEELEGQFGKGMYLVVTPRISWSWGIGDEPMFQNGKFTPHKIVWDEK